jgi:FkbM family methyltransferase
MARVRTPLTFIAAAEDDDMKWRRREIIVRSVPHDDGLTAPTPRYSPAPARSTLMLQNRTSLRRVAQTQARVIRNAVAKRAPETSRETHHGAFHFRYPSRSIVGRAVAEGLTWDPHLVGIVEALPQSALVCEVGSNIGASLLTMLSARPDLRFVCFEPSERFLPYLRSNIEDNGLGDRVRVEPRLVGPDGDRWELTSNTSTASVVSGRYDNHIPVATHELTSVGLDRYFAELGEAPAFVKVDTDGFDHKVLKSAAGLLATARPWVFVEYTPALLERVGSSPDELRRLLLDCGYETADLYRGEGDLLRAAHPLTDAIETDSYLDVVLHGSR